MKRFKREKIAGPPPAWIVYRRSPSGGLEYWDGREWTHSRRDALDFRDPGEAAALASKHGGEPARR